MTYYMDVGGKLRANLDIKEPDGINHEAQRQKTVWLESWRKLPTVRRLVKMKLENYV